LLAPLAVGWLRFVAAAVLMFLRVYVNRTMLAVGTWQRRQRQRQQHLQSQQLHCLLR